MKSISNLSPGDLVVLEIDNGCDVLHVTQPTTEGVAKVVRDLIEDQCRSGLRVSLACPDNSGFWQPLVDIGCSYFQWDSKRSPLKGWRKERTQIRKIIAQCRPSVLHLHSSKAGLIGRYEVRNRIPTLFQPNGWSFRVGPGVVRGLAYAFEVLATRRWTEHVLCVSSSEGEAIQKHVPHSKMKLVPNGIDLRKWDEPGCYTKKQAREKLGLSSTAPIAVAASRVAYQKGHDMMVKLWPQVLENYPEAQLIWVGGGDAQSEYAELTKDDDSIHFLGRKENPRTYFEAADVVVMPSRWEGHSLAMLEALATARPIVAFDVEGMKETIKPSDKICFGSVVPRGDLDAFASEVKTFFRMKESMREEIGSNAREFIATNYDLRLSGEKVRNLYACMMQESVR